jgi:hypothetical protein
MKHLYPNNFLSSFKHTCLTVASLTLGFCASAQTSAPELVFNNYKLSTGKKGEDKAVYTFSNVTTGVDAQVKINGRSSADVILNDIDISSTGYDNAFQPLVDYKPSGNISANTVSDWYMEFQVSFVKAGTTTPTIVPAFDVTGLDNDGNASLHEYLSFYGLGTFTLNNPTDISITNLLSGLLSIGKRFDGSTTESDGISTTATKTMVTNHYLLTNSFAVRVGGKATGPINIANNGRQYSLWFKSFSFTNPVITALPVYLLSFDAALKNNNTATGLNWVTSSEKNASHFIVQRSTDGDNFTDQGTIFTEEGNSTLERSYSYTDNISSVNSSLIYYRLKMVDLDGKYNYSEVIVVRLGKQAQQMDLLTYPNPAISQVRVTIPTEWQNTTVVYSMYSLNGNLVKEKMSSNAGQTESFTIADLPVGLYIIKATSGSNTAVKQFIKTK